MIAYSCTIARPAAGVLPHQDDIQHAHDAGVRHAVHNDRPGPETDAEKTSFQEYHAVQLD